MSRKREEYNNLVHNNSHSRKKLELSSRVLDAYKSKDIEIAESLIHKKDYPSRKTPFSKLNNEPLESVTSITKIQKYKRTGI